MRAATCSARSVLLIAAVRGSAADGAAARFGSMAPNRPEWPDPFPVAVTYPLGYFPWVPTVLRMGRFRVLILLPPREHEPPHVHVWHAGGEVVIELPAGDRPQAVRSVAGMRTADVTAAFWLVEEHADYLLQCWRRYHG